MRLQQNVLGRAAVSRCKCFPTFQEMTPSLKRWKTIRPWRGCLPENILLNSVTNTSSKLILRLFTFLFRKLNSWVFLEAFVPINKSGRCHISEDRNIYSESS